jgi:hypothetical protein
VSKDGESRGTVTTARDEGEWERRLYTRAGLDDRDAVGFEDVGQQFAEATLVFRPCLVRRVGEHEVVPVTPTALLSQRGQDVLAEDDRGRQPELLEVP